MYLRPAAHSIPSARQQLSLLVSLVALFALGVIPPTFTHLLPSAPLDTTARSDLSRLPLSFEPNVGQAAPTARYLAHAPGGTLYFAPSEVILSLSAGDATQPVAARMAFVGANPVAKITGGELLPGTANYYVGSNPA